jgi:hypothetical protein
MRPTCRNELIKAGVSVSDIPLVGVCTMQWSSPARPQNVPPERRSISGAIRRHGVDRKCAFSSTNDIGTRTAERSDGPRGDLTSHGASVGSRTAMITAATVRSKPASVCCSGMRST